MSIHQILRVNQGNRWILAEECDGKINRINIQVRDHEIRMGCDVYTSERTAIYKEGMIVDHAVAPFYFKFFSVSDPLMGICNYVNGVPSGEFFACNTSYNLPKIFPSNFKKADHDFLENIYKKAVLFYQKESKKEQENRFLYGNYNKKGKLDGIYVEQTTSSKIVCQYKDGILDGAWKKYGRYLDGDKLIEERVYNLGKEVLS